MLCVYTSDLPTGSEVHPPQSHKILRETLNHVLPAGTAPATLYNKSEFLTNQFFLFGKANVISNMNAVALCALKDNFIPQPLPKPKIK